MKALRLYLDEAIDRKLVKNDSDTARRLHVSRATVSDWRVGRTAPNEDQAAALAALLGKPEILADCMAARAKKPENRATWERAAHTLRIAGALGMGASVVLLTSSPVVDGAPLLGLAVSGVCVMLSLRDRRQQSAKPHLGPLRRWSDKYRAHRVKQKRIDARREKAQALPLDAALPCAPTGA